MDRICWRLTPNKNGSLPAAWLLMVLFAICGVAHAQGRATISGTITDQTGAVVPGAAVSAVNDATQQVYRTKSGSGGSYIFPALEPGEYTLTAEAAGFEKFVQTGIRLQVDQNQNSPIRLGLGRTTQQVVVNGTQLEVDTRSSTISEVVDSARVQELPLNGRNPLDLQSLVAGATETSAGGGGQAENNVISIDGGRPNENNYTLDGVDNEDPFFGTPSVYPNPDALAEFSLQTSNYDAQSGFASGAQMNAVTKSGTNQFHGTLFEYLRNEAFDAIGYFAKTRPPFRRNQFGGTVGGPIFKDHTFFFFAYQGTRTRSSPSAITLVVPDAAERSGDFSEIKKQLKDPVTGKPVPGNKFSPGELSSVSTAFLNTFVPLPNAPNNVYTYSGNSLLNDDQYIGRLDTAIRQKDHLYGRILYDANVQNQIPTGNDLPRFSANIDYVNWNLAVSDTHTFSPTLLNRITFGFNDIQRAQLPVAPVQKSWADLGSGLVPSATGPVNYTTNVQTYFTANTRSQLNQYRHGYQYSDTLSWSHNAHTVYLGGDFRKEYTHQYQNFLSDGQFVFSAFFTGNQLADFETGHENTFSEQSPNGGEPVNLVPDLFIQDNWKVNRWLTLNLGLRWNPWIPYHDLLNHVSAFRPGQQSTVFPTAPVGYVFPGDAGVTRDIAHARWKDFSPRVGFAYDVFGNGRTSVRAGYGLYNSFLREQSLNGPSNNPPFGLTLSATRPSGGIANPYSDTGNPFPFTPPQTEQEKQAYKFPHLLTLTSYDPRFRNGYVQQWNLSVQQQVKTWVFTTAYVGTVANHLDLSVEQDPAVYGRTGNTDARRIYAPNYSSVSDNFAGGHASYNGLQLSASRRIRHGFTLLANYTWSKSIDNGAEGDDPFDPFDVRLSRGLADADMAHVFVASLVWQLPELRTDRILAKRLIGGWEMAGTVSLHTGTPFSVVSGVDNSQSGVGSDLADRVPGVSPHLHHSSKAAEIAEYFNASAYVVNALGTFGDSGRNSLFGPGLENIDFAASKTLYGSESERFHALFRAEAFNLFNRTNLGQPTADASSNNDGEITDSGAPRVLQLALRVEF